MSKKKRLKENGIAHKDESSYVFQKERLKWELQIKERNNYTVTQQKILEQSLDKKTRCIMIDGLWGTGKTHLMVLAALKLLNEGKVREIIYLRNPIEASAHSRVGFLSGSLEEKMAPYNAPMLDKLDEFLPRPQVEALIKEGRITCIPTGFLQGRSFNSAVIIVDEAASMSWEDLMLIISRAGEFTRVFFIGDTLNQVYLSDKSGFKKFFSLFDDTESKDNGVFTYELKDSQDIVRSGFLRFVMRKTGIIKETL